MKYTKALKAKRLEELRNKPRIYWLPLSANNTVDGLIDLCEKYVKAKDIVVEVGSFSGVSSQVLAVYCKDLYCVDPWAWQETKEAERMFDAILPECPNIKKIQMSGSDATSFFDDASLDFVYIDADHTYQSVVADINDWKGKIKSGGYISGHDFHMEDVSRAVRDCLGEPLELFSDDSWIVKL
jgi:predicted O-methyltransferase YrrM